MSSLTGTLAVVIFSTLALPLLVVPPREQRPPPVTMALVDCIKRVHVPDPRACPYPLLTQVRPDGRRSSFTQKYTTRQLGYTSIALAQ